MGPAKKLGEEIQALQRQLQDVEDLLDKYAKAREKRFCFLSGAKGISMDEVTKKYARRVLALCITFNGGLPCTATIHSPLTGSFQLNCRFLYAFVLCFVHL